MANTSRSSRWFPVIRAPKPSRSPWPNGCPSGYGAQGNNCVDIDECADDPCGAAPCDNLPGSWSCPIQCTEAAFHAAVDGYVAACEQWGSAPEKPASGKMMLRVAPIVHAAALKAAARSGISLNKWAEQALGAAAR